MNAGKAIGIILLLVTMFSCHNKLAKQAANKGLFIAISAELPLNLGAVDFNDESKTIRLNEEVSSKIDAVVKEYANTIVWDETYPHTDTDAYINTICLQGKQYTVYVVLLKHFPTTERVNSVVLFYDNGKNEFVEGQLNFRIDNLYYFYDGRLNPTNLKTEFNITAPEIELTDFNMDGIDDFKLTRLIHNGTYNAIEIIAITAKNSTIDTLFYDEVKPYEY